MSVHLKIANVNTHVVDILGSVKGRDQPVMKMDKAVELVKCLDEEVFSNDNYVFFDPFCKAGEILLATVFVSILHKSKRKLVSLDAVYREIYQSDRYFALAPDERHYNLSLRTFYGNEKSHDKDQTQNIKNGAYLSEIDGRLDKEKFNRRLKAMLEYITEKTRNKKIVAVGNPPYQEEDSSQTTGASPIYPKLIKTLVEQNKIDKMLLVIPSRWFNGGGRLQNFLDWTMKCDQIQAIKHFEDSKIVFPQVSIAGGICFFSWTKEKSKQRKTNIFYKEKNTKKLLNQHEILMLEEESYNILEIIKNQENTFVSDVAWSGKPFNLRTNYFKKNSSLNKKNKNSISCYSKGRRIFYANKEHILKNRDKINEWKIACPATYGAKRIPPREQFFMIQKDEICLETYNIIHSFKTKKEGNIFLNYINTVFVRFLLGLAKNTQRIVKEHWRFVPLSLYKEFKNDKEIFEFFVFKKKEIDHIKEKEKLWSSIKV